MLFGTGLFGAVDVVDDESGSALIATRFVHVFGVPLFPLGSKFVPSPRLPKRPELASVRGLDVPLDLRSLVLGYFSGLLRVTAALATVAFFVALICFMINQLDWPTLRMTSICCSVAATFVTAATRLTRRLTRAAPPRAKALVARLRESGLLPGSLKLREDARD